MTVSEPEIRKQGALNGIPLGIILMVLSIFSFYFVTAIAGSFWMITLGPVIFSVVVPLVIAALYSGDLRKKIGGFWKFRQAVTGIFIMLAVAYVITYVGANLIFGKLIEPQMTEKTQNAIQNATIKYMESKDVSQEQIDKSLDQMQKQFDMQKNLSAGKIITAIAISLIMIFVLALIYAAIYKRDPPLYDIRSIDEDADPVV